MMSKWDIPTLSKDKNINQSLKRGINIAKKAGKIVNKIIGKAENNIAWHLFHAPNAGITYAVFEVKKFLYGKKHILSTFLPDIKQKTAWHNSCTGSAKIKIPIKSK